jgi:hypothetical protein
MISASLKEYIGQYNKAKYPADTYIRARRAFSTPGTVTSADIKEALLWKYGHLRKSRYPQAHLRLIKDVQRIWPSFVSSGFNKPETASRFWSRELGRPKAFITIAFLVHLLHQKTLPIIDQHNFRAVNYYVRQVRPSWRSKRLPSSLEDHSMVAAFITSIRRAWPAGLSKPSARDLDKYLMMFGKELKRLPRVPATA